MIALQNIRNGLGPNDVIFCTDSKRASKEQFVFRRLTAEDKKKFPPLETQQPSLAEIPPHMRNSTASTRDSKPTAHVELQLRSPTEQLLPNTINLLPPENLPPGTGRIDAHIRGLKRKREDKNTKNPRCAKKKKAQDENTPPNNNYAPPSKTRATKPLFRSTRPPKRLDKARIEVELRQLPVVRERAPYSIDAQLDYTTEVDHSVNSPLEGLPATPEASPSVTDPIQTALDTDIQKVLADLELDAMQLDQLDFNAVLKTHFASFDSSCALPTLNFTDRCRQSTTTTTNASVSARGPVIRKLSRSPRLALRTQIKLYLKVVDECHTKAEQAGETLYDAVSTAILQLRDTISHTTDLMIHRYSKAK